jgi:hypothetical protein
MLSVLIAGDNKLAFFCGFSSICFITTHPLFWFCSFVWLTKFHIHQDIASYILTELYTIYKTNAIGTIKSHIASMVTKVFGIKSTIKLPIMPHTPF